MGLESAMLDEHPRRALYDSAHCCQELHWIDESLGCVLNASMFTRTARFHTLEVLELANRMVVYQGEFEPLKGLLSPETELYPVLHDLTLRQIHPAVLCLGLKHKLPKLPLKDYPIAGGYVSDLFYLLEERLHLETLELIRATSIIDVQLIAGRLCRPSQFLPAPPHTNLILNGVLDLWCIFQLLEMPYLETLSHLVPSVLREPHWPHIFRDAFSDHVPDASMEVLQLQHLDLEYDILDPGRPLAHLAHLVFLNLSELRITSRCRVWEHDLEPSSAVFQRAMFPPSIFRQLTFENLTVPRLAHTNIDVPRMWEFLQHSTSELALLSLENACVGPGALVYALGSPALFDVYLHGQAHPLPLPPPSSNPPTTTMNTKEKSNNGTRTWTKTKMGV